MKTSIWHEIVNKTRKWGTHTTATVGKARKLLGEPWLRVVQAFIFDADRHVIQVYRQFKYLSRKKEKRQGCADLTNV